METRGKTLTRRSQPLSVRSSKAESQRRPGPSNGQVLRRSRKDRRRTFGSQAAIVWIRRKPHPHARQDRQASSVRAGLWRADRDQKSPVRRCFKSRLPLERDAPVLLRLPVFSGTVDWPLVQIPADRHTTTGTCVLGKVVFGRIVGERKSFFSGRWKNLRELKPRGPKTGRALNNTNFVVVAIFGGYAVAVETAGP